MAWKKISGIKIDNITTVKTFIRLSQIRYPGTEQMGEILSFWQNAGLPNNVREFSFKYFNNILGINTRLSHFVADQSRNCIFCSLEGRISDETFSHIFFDCDTSTRIRRNFEQNYLAWVDTTIQDRKKFWFTGIIKDDKFNFFLAALVVVFNFSLWSFKLKKKIPTWYNFKLVFFGMLQKISVTCPQFFFDLNNYNYVICRDIRDLLRQYGAG